MFLRSLKKLSVKDERSLIIKQIVSEKIIKKQLTILQDCMQVTNTELVPLDADIHEGNWAVGLSIHYTDQGSVSRELRLFIKQTSQTSFFNERSSVEQLEARGFKRGFFIDYPIEFIEDHFLIVSALHKLTNEKNHIRQCHQWPFMWIKKKYTLTRIRTYAHWLFHFHQQSNALRLRLPKQFNQPPNPQEHFYPCNYPLLYGNRSERLINHIQDYLSQYSSEYCCFIHGDFGPQNILADQNEFKVIDWERFRLDYDIRDCVDFIINILRQGRYFIYDWKFTREMIFTFIREYAKHAGKDENYIVVSILLAINDLIKNQEWATIKLPRYFLMLYLPLLREFANETYAYLKY